MAQRFTREIAQKIVDLVRVGNYIEVAARANSISPATVFYWLRVGEGRHPDRKATIDLTWFSMELRKAESHAETGLVKDLLEQLPDEPRLIIEFLARRWPERWGKREIAKLTEPEWKEEAKRLILSGEMNLIT